MDEVGFGDRQRKIARDLEREKERDRKKEKKKERKRTARMVEMQRAGNGNVPPTRAEVSLVFHACRRKAEDANWHRQRLGNLVRE